MGKIRNLGLKGLFVGTPLLLEQGDLVHLSFRMPTGELMSVSGLVWWTTLPGSKRHRTQGFGLRLIDDNMLYEKAFGRLAHPSARASVAV